jgi:hypothetical protein
MAANLGINELVIRSLVGIGIAASVISLSQIPAWIALFTPYPFFTAILRWDPFYALYLTAIRRKDIAGMERQHPHTSSGIAA